MRIEHAAMYVNDLEKAKELCRQAWPADEAGMEGIRNDFYNAPNDLSQVLSELEKAIGDTETEKQLQELMEYLKDDPCMDMFNSGGGGDFSNHYKNVFLLKGVTRNPDPLKGYDVITSNYIDGVSEEEYAALANSLAEGPFNRSKKTEVGGYWVDCEMPPLYINVWRLQVNCR